MHGSCAMHSNMHSGSFPLMGSEIGTAESFIHPPPLLFPSETSNCPEAIDDKQLTSGLTECDGCVCIGIPSYFPFE